MAKDQADDVPHPRETHEFFGHAAAESALLEAYRSGRVAHAWLHQHALMGGERTVRKICVAKSRPCWNTTLRRRAYQDDCVERRAAANPSSIDVLWGR